MKVYIKLFRYLLPYKTHIILTWIISVFLLALDGISVWIAAGFLEKIISGKTLVVQQESSNVLTRFLDHISVNILQQSTPFKSLLVGASALIGARLFISLLRIIKLFIFARVDESILKKIRQDLFSHITRLDISFSQNDFFTYIDYPGMDFVVNTFFLTQLSLLFPTPGERPDQCSLMINYTVYLNRKSWYCKTIRCSN